MPWRYGAATGGERGLVVHCRDPGALREEKQRVSLWGEEQRARLTHLELGENALQVDTIKSASMEKKGS